MVARTILALFQVTRMTSQEKSSLTLALVARIPAEGVPAFREYEDAVLPLLAEFGGRLERRLRNSDGTLEMHLVSFSSEAGFQKYRNDPRRAALAGLLQKSQATLELHSLFDVS
jgi:hypothetical protein